ncbi:GTPase RhebL1 [Hirundo rustica]|uniref:GTPase RhebL1 n=1 Tax=Hirundo rustica TaxID=43150 RepID=UPI002671EB20|nr:GTPase RhebL1 [Hirundo rustica]
MAPGPCALEPPRGGVLVPLSGSVPCPGVMPGPPSLVVSHHPGWILPRSFLVGIHGCILVYSVTSLQSFQMVKTLHSKMCDRGDLHEAH